jgi:hypothetical protein
MLLIPSQTSLRRSLWPWSCAAVTCTERKRDIREKSWYIVGVANGGKMVRMVNCGDYRGHRGSFWPPARHADKVRTRQGTVIGLSSTLHFEDKHRARCFGKSTCKNPTEFNDQCALLAPYNGPVGLILSLSPVSMNKVSAGMKKRIKRSFDVNHYAFNPLAWTRKGGREREYESRMSVMIRIYLLRTPDPLYYIYISCNKLIRSMLK